MKKIIFLLSVAIIGICLAEVPPFKPGFHAVEAPVGRLGHRIGSYLTIEGIRGEQGKSGVRTLLVDTVNGYKLDEPVSIWIENAELPKGERCVLKGYESGRWVGVPPEVLQATGRTGPQAAWQFLFYFLATSAEQPKGLKIN